MNEDLEWKPQPEGLQQIIQLLKESQSIDNTIQKNVQKVGFFRVFLTVKESSLLIFVYYF